MRQFTAAMQVSPDLAAAVFERHRQRRRHVLRAGLAVGAAGALTAAAVTVAVAHGHQGHAHRRHRRCELAC